ncbi:MAG: hypothetical protein RL684_1614 [Pseudomonadota bacterium]
MNAQAQHLLAGLASARLDLLPEADFDGDAPPAGAATGEYHPLRPLLERLETELERDLVLLPPWSVGTERARRALLEYPEHEDTIADLLAREAGLAVRLLAFANASPFGRGGRELAELRPAVRRIGHLNLLAIVHAHALAQLRHSPRMLVVREPLGAQWHAATEVAALARRIAWRHGGDADLAFLCGLLHNCGRSYLTVRCAALGLESMLEAAAPAMLWRWQSRLGAALVRAWRLPDQVGRALARQGHLGGVDEDETGALLAAATLAHAGGAPASARATLLAEESGFGFDAGQWRDLMTRASTEAACLRVLLGD